MNALLPAAILCLVAAAGCSSSRTAPAASVDSPMSLRVIIERIDLDASSADAAAQASSDLFRAVRDQSRSVSCLGLSPRGARQEMLTGTPSAPVGTATARSLEQERYTVSLPADSDARAIDHATMLSLWSGSLASDAAEYEVSRVVIEPSDEQKTIAGIACRRARVAIESATAGRLAPGFLSRTVEADICHTRELGFGIESLEYLLFGAVGVPDADQLAVIREQLGLPLEATISVRDSHVADQLQPGSVRFETIGVFPGGSCAAVPE